MIEVVLLKRSSFKELSDYVYKFDNLLEDAVYFIDLSLKNGHEVAIRQTKE